MATSTQPTAPTQPHIQDIAYAKSIQDPEGFWSQQAQQLHWFRRPDRALERVTRTLPSGTTHESWSWFPGGEINTCYNCVDRHVDAGFGDENAIIWDSPVSGNKERYTYAQLKYEVETLAAVLMEEGVQKGDVVLVYMPMIPAALIGMLAAARLGAIHAVVFGGFSPPALAQRIDSSRPKVILTASCGIEGSKGALPYQPLVIEALKKASHKLSRTIVWQRTQSLWHPFIPEEGERHWQQLVKSAKTRGLRAPCVPIKSSDPLYIIYTDRKSVV